MLRHLLVVIVVAPLLHAQDLAHDPGVREMFWQLISRTRSGFSHEEAAAFVVQSPAGYRCVAWPHDDNIDSARWEGPLPGGVIAIIHTHPNWMSSPSSIDKRTARVAHLPVYVITRTRITKTDGQGMQTVVSGDWKPEVSAHPCAEMVVAGGFGGRRSVGRIRAHMPDRQSLSTNQ
jgi:Prokaryotic homologs of the JAB domain